MMRKIVGAVLCGALSFLLVLAVNGCQPNASREGIHVMFDGNPKIYNDQVYFHGRSVGKILAKQGMNGPVTRVDVMIDSQAKKESGQHWAFYVDSGRLTVGRLNSSGRPINAGDRVCGFHSKAAFSWFKVKTLLSNRISKASRRADKLYLRFSQAG